jgi:biopolymer transport protein ExbD
MNLVPEEELKRSMSMNLAPMVDFLFLIMAMFATMAITRSYLVDNDISLVTMKPKKDVVSASQKPSYLINISITQDGQYKWMTDVKEVLIKNPEGIQTEFYRQQKSGELPSNKEHTRVLLHIDKEAQWESIAQAIFAIKQSGFQIYPVYEASE